MFPTSLSSHFAVRRLTEGDLAQILDLCRGNPLFYRYCPPSPSAESIREDMKSLPPGVEPENKFYLGLFDGDGLAAVLDLVLHYPEAWDCLYRVLYDRRGPAGAGYRQRDG